MFACFHFLYSVCFPIFFIDYLLVVSMCYKLFYQNANLCFVCSPSPFLFFFAMYKIFVLFSTYIASKRICLMQKLPQRGDVCRRVVSRQGRKIVFGVVGIGGRVGKSECGGA